MINLLPDNMKQQIRAARANSSLIKLVIFLGFAVIFLGSACGVSYMFLTNTKKTAENIIATNQLKSNSYSSVLSQANSINSDLATAKGILDQQISYSNIIIGIAKILPSGVILDGTLTLSKDTLSVPIVLKMRAKTTDSVAQLKTNFQKSLLFSGYNLQSLSTSANDSTGYPVMISIGITINKSATL